MTKKRIQCVVAEGDADLFRRFAGAKHSGWPHQGGKRAYWARAALRVAHQHATRPEGVEWFIVKGKSVGKALALLSAPEERSARKKVDVELEPPDAKRIDALMKQRGVATASEVVRLAVHFLSTIELQLSQSGVLMHGKRTGVHAPVNLAAIIADGADPQQVPHRAPSRREAHTPLSTDPPALLESNDVDRFLAIVWVTATFNVWLTSRVESVTLRAERSSLRKLRADSAMGGEDAAHSESRKWQARLDIQRLFREFWLQEEQALCSGISSALQHSFEHYQLLPVSWVRKQLEGDRIHHLAGLGAEAIRSFLLNRFRNLRAWDHSIAGTFRTARAEEPESLWRNWTRSRVTADGYREIDEPIEWTAVAHHALQRASGESLVAHELQTVIVQAFGARNARHLDAVASACTGANRALQGRAVISGDDALEVNETLISLDELLQKLATASDGATSAEDNLSASERLDIAKLIYLFMALARIVRPVFRWQVPEPAHIQHGEHELIVPTDVQLCIRSLAYADLSELRARIFGAQTSIDGLHWVLHGGIVPRGNRGRAWLVTGRAGSGKSIFALALAADMARRGRTAIVICSDERVDVVKERLVTFGLRDDSRYAVVERTEFEDLAESSISEMRQTTARGLLVIYGAPEGADTPAAYAGDSWVELCKWLTRLSEQASNLCKSLKDQKLEESDPAVQTRLHAHLQRWRWIGVVVDSIDALEVSSVKSTDMRTLMTQLMQSVEASRIWAILICGADNPMKQALTYLVDTVIEIGADGSELERRLQIQKCRTQAYDSGHHVLRLVQSTGVVVHPNLASIQRAVTRRARRQLDHEHVVYFPERILWPGCANTQTLQRFERSRELPHIRRASNILLHGTPQSGKRPLLMNLISQRMELAKYPNWRLGATGSVLLVSFRRGARECLSPLRESPALARKWQETVSDTQFRWYRADATLRAEQIAHELVHRIQHSRRDCLPLDWIVFLGVEALKTYLPAVEDERGFWPTILAITTSEEISTVFVVNGSDDNFVTQHRMDMDYVLRFRREEKSDERLIDIEKSAAPPPLGGYPTLRINLEAGTLRMAQRSDVE